VRRETKLMTLHLESHQFRSRKGPSGTLGKKRSSRANTAKNGLAPDGNSAIVVDIAEQLAIRFAA